jgi:translation elongation factor EF-G
MRIMDTAVIVVNATEGVEDGTEIELKAQGWEKA